jgi:hypothetical protein
MLIMPVKKQISIVQENRVGSLFKICAALIRKKVNIVALCIHDANEYGILRLVVDNPGKARQVLTREKLTFSATNVLAIELDNEPGALAKVTKKLARQQINIEYAYASATGEKALVILKVSDTDKADRLLSGMKS